MKEDKKTSAYIGLVQKWNIKRLVEKVCFSLSWLEAFLMTLSFEVFPHNIERATENFSMNVLDIKREESDRHEENTDEKDDKNGQVFRIGKCRGKLRVEKVLAEEDVEAGDGGNGGDADTEIPGKPKRNETQRNKAVEGEPCQFPEIIARCTMEALIGIKENIGAPKSEPIDESACHAVDFGKAVEFIDNHSIEQSKIG